MKFQKTVMVAAMASLLAACNPAPPQLTQMCGFNAQTGQQGCVMVPANQTAQYYNQGYYSNNNGVYRDSGGHEVAAAVVGAAGGYALSQYMNNRKATAAPQYAVPAGYYQTANGRWKGPDGKFVSDPTKGNFVPQAAAVTPTTKAPTGGMMAGQREIQLTPATNQVAQQQAPKFQPKGMAVPQAAQTTANPFQPQAANKAPLNTFTPKAAMQTPTPKAEPYKPKAVSLAKSTPTKAPTKAPAKFTPKASK